MIKHTTVPRALCLAGGLLLTLAVPARAVLFTGFEPTDDPNLIAGVTGDASYQNFATGGVAPTQGVQHILLTTFDTAGDGASSSVSGTDAVGVTQLANFFFTDASLITFGANQGQVGSGIYFVLTLGAPGSSTNRATFDYDFVTSELTGANNVNPDFAFLVTAPLNSSNQLTANPTISLLPGANAVTGVFSNSLSPNFDVQTPYQTGTFSAPAAGNYLIGFGVADANTSSVQSGLFLDNIQIVPEPSTWALVLGGVVTLSSVALRRRQGVAL